MSTVNKNTNVKNLKTDIVVVGGGGGGLTAAVRAAESGAKVVLLEKTDILGGASLMAGGISSVNSKIQVAAGTSECLKEHLFSAMMNESRWLAHPGVVRRMVNTTGVFADWVNTKDPGSVKTFPEHRFVEWQRGSGYCKMMAKYCNTKYGIDLYMETRATRLLTDKNGTIIGVLASSKDTEYKIKAKSVILSTGSFSRNREMLKKYFPDCFDNDFDLEFEGEASLGRFADGDGIRMAQEIGSMDDHHMDVLIATAHHQSRKTAGGMAISGIPARPELILVNNKGKRFMAEILKTLKGRTILLQPNAITYAVFDSDSLDYFLNTPNPIPETGTPVARPTPPAESDALKKAMEGLKAETKLGCTKIANTLDEIAEYIGVDPTEFKIEIERYNTFCDKGRDDDFYKDPKYLRPIRKAPFYALKNNVFWQCTRGGIVINENMEVVNKKGAVIKGLYATGDNAGGWCSNFGYVFMTGLTWALVSGYMAAESSYEYTRSIK